MKAKDIRTGTRATTMIGSVRSLVTIVGMSVDGRSVIVRSHRSGQDLYRTPRQLTAEPAPAAAIKLGPARPGQTIELDDIVITTTLHTINL